DSQYNELCDFDFAEDGKIRCMPRVRTFLPTFADSACGKPVGAEVTVLNCGPRNGLASLAQGPWCGPVVRTFHLGAPAPAPYRKNAAGTCAALNGVGYAELGDLVPPATFVEAQLVRD